MKFVKIIGLVAGAAASYYAIDWIRTEWEYRQMMRDLTEDMNETPPRFRVGQAVITSLEAENEDGEIMEAGVKGEVERIYFDIGDREYKYDISGIDGPVYEEILEPDEEAIQLAEKKRGTIPAIDYWLATLADAKRKGNEKEVAEALAELRKLAQE
jgi:hypothetical protein